MLTPGVLLVPERALGVQQLPGQRTREPRPQPLLPANPAGLGLLRRQLKAEGPLQHNPGVNPPYSGLLLWLHPWHARPAPSRAPLPPLLRPECAGALPAAAESFQ